MSFGSQNPFQAPNFTDLPAATKVDNSSGLSSSILIQLRVLAILLLVHGGLVILMGLFFAAMAVAMPMLLDMQKAQMKQFGQPPPNLPLEAQKMMLLMYGAIGAAGVMGGLVQIAAGFRLLWLKGRILGFVALASCLVSCLTCYCIPTSLGLAVYGLIVLAHPSAERAFALSAEGRTFDEILQAATRPSAGAL